MKMCFKCKGKGFIESVYSKNSSFYPSIRRCPEVSCPHEKEFCTEVANRYGKAADPNTSNPPDHKTIINIPSKEVEDFELEQPMPQVNYQQKPIELPSGFENYFLNLKATTDQKAVIVLSTALGQCIVGSIEEAYRVIMIVDKYVQHGELLDWCSKFPNVKVFPLPKSLKVK